ncbi:sialidase family protein [Amycolatopsis samaneae]|uniref:Photosynthesis system II assembly factor Ycf48/Hcf136-like domain-containing protein n=2 Tax=Amycolatopsis samaneae TaxID=664691 RepID=A0ABW5GTX9_9PSEU
MTCNRAVSVVFALLVLSALFAPMPPASAEPAVPEGFAPASASWADADDGYVLGYAPCAGSRWCPVLLGTTDGGTRWQRLGAPSLSLPDNHNHVQLSYFGAGRAYVSDGNRLEATRDGGRTWSAVTLADTGNAFYLGRIAETHGRTFALLSTYGETGSTRLYSGVAGTPLLAPVPGFVATGGLTYGDLAVGGGLQVVLGADYGVERYWTAADGEHLTPAPAPCPAGSTAALGGVREGRVVALCSGSAGSPRPGSMTRGVRHAPGLGGEFTGTAQGPAQGIHQGFGAATANSVTVAAVGGGADFLHGTDDGGATWHTTVLGDHGAGLADLDFPGTDTGIVVAGAPDDPNGSAVFRTTDGGRSWHELTIG